MSKPDISQLRNIDRFNELNSFIAVSSAWLSIPLFLAFWIADILYVPSLKWEFLALRLLIIPTSMVVHKLIKRSASLLKTQIIGTCYVLANSLPITIMVFMSEGERSPYYAGLNLVTICTLAFFPWTRRFLIFNLSQIYLPFYAFALFRGISSPSAIIIHSFFIFGTIIITMVIRYYSEQIRNKELSSRIRLQDEIDSRQVIIQQKTNEGLQLASLSKQFSPQVVHAIRSGSLNLNQAIQRAQVCAIFIDIVNSTDRIIRLDQTDVKKVISMFMEHTMKVMLKYDITIDKFLGDGVLGFSNNPIQHPDYVGRVVDAALEIKSKIYENRETYLQHWLNELQIRVGISTGYANVGFYGSEEYFKSYTAIGRVINLASRLCSSAEANQIIVSQDVINHLSGVEYEIKKLGSKTLKGFESDLINTFEIMSSKTGFSKNTDVESCPNGHGVLHLDTGVSGIYSFKCRSCDYVLEAPSENKLKAA